MYATRPTSTRAGPLQSACNGKIKLFFCHLQIFFQFFEKKIKPGLGGSGFLIMVDFLPAEGCALDDGAASFKVDFAFCAFELEVGVAHF